ncbi:MAG: hypothetical protein ACI4KF_08225 [Huintestinicola sp.]
MKITDAFWEKRNLGVECIEIHIEKNDTIDDIARGYEAVSEKEYMVVRIPSSRSDASAFFQRKGYFFIEAAITLCHDLKEIKLSKAYEKICSGCSYAPMNEEDISCMKREIDRNIFRTDRISADPAFTSEQAANRFKYWIDDTLKNGMTPYKVMYGGETVGFLINKELDGGVFDGVLSAVYKDFEGTGMGLCIQYAGLQTAIDRGGKKYIGHISASNPQMMKLLETLGFRVTDMEYIFVKHN